MPEVLSAMVALHILVLNKLLSTPGRTAMYFVRWKEICDAQGDFCSMKRGFAVPISTLSAQLRESLSLLVLLNCLKIRSV